MELIAEHLEVMDGQLRDHTVRVAAELVDTVGHGMDQARCDGPDGAADPPDDAQLASSFPWTAPVTGSAAVEAEALVTPTRIYAGCHEHG